MPRQGVQVVYSADASQVTRALKQVEAANAALHSRLSAIGGQMVGIGRTLRHHLSLPALAAAGAATKLAVDFEESMDKIIGLVGVSRIQVEGWSKQILEMGRQLPQSPRELADALFFVTSAGFRGKEAMDVLLASAKGAAAGLGETKVVADAVTSAVNAYGIANLSASAATDVLVATVREGKVAADQVAGAIGRVIPIASEMGVGFDEVGAAIASMTITGLGADEAVTALRGFLVALLKPADKSRDALTKLGLAEQDLVELSGGMNLALARSGLTIDELRRTVAEKGLFEGMKLLKGAIGDNQDALGRIIPNVRALTGFLSVAGQRAEANAGIFQRLATSTGSAERAFRTAAETAKFKFQATLSSIQATAIQLANVFLPALEKIAGAIGKAFGALGNLSPALQKTAAMAVILAAVAGPLVGILGRMTQGVGLLVQAIRFLLSQRFQFFLAETAVKAIKAAEGIKAAATATTGFAAAARAATATIGIVIGLAAVFAKVVSDDFKRARTDADAFARSIEKGFFPEDRLKAVTDEIGRMVRQIERLKAEKIEALITQGSAAADQLRWRITSLGFSLAGLRREQERLRTQVVKQLIADLKEQDAAFQALAASAGQQAAAQAAASGASASAMREQAAAADQLRESVKSSFEQQTSIVAAFGDSVKVTKAEVLEFFRAQTAAAETWAANLKELARLGLDKGLMQELRQAGPKAAGLVKGLLDAVNAGGLAAINEGRAKMRTVLAQITAPEPSAVTAAAEDGELIGGQFIAGIGAAMTSPEAVRTLQQAALFAVETVKTKAVDLARVRSPSRLMAEQVGLPLAQGIAAGLLGGQGELERALSQLIGSLAGGVSVGPGATPAAPRAIGGDSASALAAALAKALVGITVELDGREVGRVVNRRLGAEADLLRRAG